MDDLIKALSALYSAEDGSREKDEAYDVLLRALTLNGGSLLIAQERVRQVEEERFVPEYDAGRREELARAAACYATPPEDRKVEYGVPTMWPWTSDYWKPTERERELVKAGALAAAAIDTMIRARRKAKPDA